MGKEQLLLIILLSSGYVIAILYVLGKNLFKECLEDCKKCLEDYKKSKNSIQCPSCLTELELPPDCEGQEVRCPQCNNRFVIPEKFLKRIKQKTKRVLTFAIIHEKLTSAIILALSIIIYAIINYNTDRYYLHKESQQVPFILDKNAGKLYSPASSIKEYNWNLCDPIKKARK